MSALPVAANHTAPIGGGLAGNHHQPLLAPAVPSSSGGGGGSGNPVPYAEVLQTGFIGDLYTEQFFAQGGTPSYAYSLSGGALPSGLIVTSGGLVSGVPSATGTFFFNVAVSDVHALVGTGAFQIVIDEPLAPAPDNPVPYSSILETGFVGEAYSEQFFSQGGTPSYAYAVTSGSLPSGLIMTSGGLVSGTPLASGAYSFIVQTTDSHSLTGSGAFEIYVDEVPAPIVTVIPFASTIQDASINTPYDEVFSADGGTSPYSFVILSGALPPGLSLSSSGAITGSPTAMGTYSFEVQATDANGATGSESFNLTVDAGPLVVPIGPDLLSGTLQMPYSESLDGQGGTPPYSFAIGSGVLPSGLVLNSSGIISGTPLLAQMSTFDVVITDANGFTGSQQFSLGVAGPYYPTIVPFASGLPPGQMGYDYAEYLEGAGGSQPYVFGITASGSLPPGLSLDSYTGLISGIPTESGAFEFTVAAFDAEGFEGFTTFSIDISYSSGTVPTITVMSDDLADAFIGSYYSQSVSAVGGASPYVFSVTDGLTPSGIVMDSTGALQGTPTATGSFTFTVQAEDQNGYAAATEFTLNVNPAYPSTVVVPTGKNLHDGVRGNAYSETISAQGGTTPYTFGVSGTLPTGLTFDDTTGIISGTPIESGTFNFTINVLDSLGYGGSTDFTITVNEPDTGNNSGYSG